MSGAGRPEEHGSPSAEVKPVAETSVQLNGICLDLEMLTVLPILKMLNFPNKSKLNGLT